MREILFRGKRTETKNWVEGSLLIYDDGDCDICSESGMPNELFKYAVAPETVGQYTGLTDKNGTKIFEGDVCYINDGQIDEEEGVFIVEWDEDSARFILNGCYFIDFVNIYGHQVEVIGNIHDNPELLTEERT